MSDNIHLVPDAETAPEKRRISRRLIALALASFVLVSLLVLLLSDSVALDGLRRAVRYLGKTDGSYGHIALDGVANASFDSMDGALVLSDGNTLRLFDEDGSLTARLTLSASCDGLCVAGRRALCYDIGGNALLLSDAAGNTLQKSEAAGTILDADLSEEGYVALLYAGENTRGILELYNENGAMVYRYRSSSHFANVCAVSPDGANAVLVAIGQEEVLFRSTALLLRSDSADEATELSLGEQLIFDISFLDAHTLCAIGEKSAMFFDTDGALLGEYAFGDSSPVCYRFVSDGVLLALDTFSASGRYRVLRLGPDGTEQLCTEADGLPLSLSAQGNYLCVLTAQTLTVYDRSARVRFSRENDGKYSFAAVRTDGTVLAAGSEEADLLIP